VILRGPRRSDHYFGDVVTWINSGGADIPKRADPEAVKILAAN
jgi:hypothetical protein